MIETFQLITLAVCCSYVSNLIGRRTINIPEIILGVHGLMGFTVNLSMYIINIIHHGKCMRTVFMHSLTSLCQKSHLFTALTSSISDT